MNYIVKLLILVCLIFSVVAKADNSGLAVVLVDMQIGFYERGGTTDTQELKDLVAKDKELLEWAVENDVPVLVLEYQGFKNTDPKLMSVIENYTHAVIEKNRDGGFDGQSEDAVINQLKEWGVDTLIVAGINGCCCVKQTALGAIRNGLDVMTSSDIVGNINQNPPLYPNQSWFFKNNKFVVYDDLDQLIY